MIIVKFFCLLLYVISYLIPRNKNVWLFGSETGFDGNTKYFLVYVSENHKNVRPIWVSKRKPEIAAIREKGYEAYYSFSIKGLYYSLIAGKYIVSGSLADINFYTSGRAKYVQLWHGIGIKCCLWNNKNSILNKKNKLVGFIERPSFYLEPNYIMGASQMMNDIFAKMFRADVGKCHSTLYPRCEILFRNKKDIETYVEKNEDVYTRETIERIKKFSKVFLYMPTYRDGDPLFLEKQNWNLNLLDEFLVENNSLLIVKLHPHMKCSIDFSNFDNIIYLNKKIDMYPIMPFTDVLISDYSSVYYDYILMENKQIILYVPDMENYIKTSRDLLMDYRENTVGLYATTFEELLYCMRTEEKCDYTTIRDKFWGNAPERRLNVLFEEIDGL